MAITAGIDTGTQSTKVLVYDSETGKVLHVSSSPHELISRQDGSREQMAHWYRDAIKNCFDAIPSEIRERIEGIGVSGQQHGFVAMDKNGNVIAPVKLWCDTSTSAQCDELTEKLGGKERVFSLIGNQILPGYTASKILALKENNPEAYGKLAHILLPHDYVNWLLTGDYVMEYGDASGTALLDVVNRKWSQEVLNAIDDERDIRAMLPRLIGCDEPAGYVSKEASELFGIKEGIVVSCGGGDNMMAAIGTGCVDPGSLVMSMGTSGTLFGYSDKPVTDEKGRLAAFMSSSGGYLPLLCTMNCTVTSEQIRALFEMDVKELDRIASQAKPGCDGVSILPYFNGERVPNYPNGKAVIAGLTAGNTNRANIARASLESAVFGMKVGLDAFIEQGFEAKELILVGGGAKSRIWAQMVSDVFSLPVVLSMVGESAAFGGAVQALALIEKKTISEECAKHCVLDKENSFKPDMSLREQYDAAYANYRKYDDALAPLFR